MHPVAVGLASALLARAKDGEGVKSGPIGLAVILVLCVACYFLFKSMSKHLRRVREEFPNGEPPREREPEATADQVETGPAVTTPDDGSPPKPDSA